MTIVNYHLDTHPQVTDNTLIFSFMEVLLESSTLKSIFYGLLLLALLANGGALAVYLFTQISATLTVTAIFDLIFIFPTTLGFGLYAWLVGEGRKVKSEALTNSLFKKAVKISQ